MPFGVPSYNVLLVCASESIASAVRALLHEAGHDRVKTVSDAGAAKRAVGETAYDFVIVNAPLPDGAGTRFAIDLCVNSNTVVLLLVRAELYADITEKAGPYGVYTLEKPVSRPMMFTALGWMASTRERLRRNETKTLTLEEKMEEIRLVNRAKWLLIDREGMDEPAAHRLIEKQAMDRCVTRRTVAQEIIERLS